MRVTVFRLYHHGQRLSCPAGPWVGDLVTTERNDGTGDDVAKVVGVHERDLPHLHWAKVKITLPGLILRGREIIARRTNNKSGADRFPQVWWALTDQCAIDAVMLQQLEQTVRDEEALEQEIRADHTDGDWTDLALTEVARLSALRTMRMEHIERLRQELQSRREARAAAVSGPGP